MGEDRGKRKRHTSQVDPFVNLNRIHAAVYTVAIIAFFYYQTFQLISSTSALFLCFSLPLLFSNVVLAFEWVVTQAFHWRPIRRKPLPHHLSDEELGGIDVFICTADPYKEPPMGVVNTALSVMAYDYPMEKLSVYVSDDGGSELTLFSFLEAARFARYWLPFCRNNGIKETSPEVYFQSCSSAYTDLNHQRVKDLYEKMKENVVKGVVEKGRVDNKLLVSTGDIFALLKWRSCPSGSTPQEHPSVIHVLLESREHTDITGHPLPNLIYVSREKRKDYPHHFKAGALNALLRVSSVMTNAPFVLNLDCDMNSNDPTTPRKAMCFLSDETISDKLAFVQFPQRFNGIDHGDIYGSEYMRQYLINPWGMNGIKGPMYVGSNTFFNRRAIDEETTMEKVTSFRSEELFERARKVAGAAYEVGTKWGSKVGMRYGSLLEDFNTGYMLHCEGWESIFLDPERPAFLGEVPITLHDALTQTKRWVVGLLELFFSVHCPVIFGVRRGSLLLAMCYTHNSFWSSWSIPIICYGIIPQLALVHGFPLFPKVYNGWGLLYLYLFLASYLQELVDFLRVGGSTLKWWNDQRMWLIRGVTCYPFGILEFLLTQMGFSSINFNVTSKVTESDQIQRYKEGKFDLGVESPFMVSIGVFATTSLVGLVVGFLMGLWNGCVGDVGLQLLLCGFVVVNCWPIYGAMIVRKDRGRMPWKCVKQAFLITGVVFFAGHLLFMGHLSFML